MAELPPVNPLTEADLAKIQEGLRAVEIGLQQVAMARAAGLNVDSQESTLKQHRDQLMMIKQVYFPGR